MSHETVDFRGVAIAATSPQMAADELISRATGDAPAAAYRLVNAYSFVVAERDGDYRALLRGPGVNLPDGGPLARVLDRTSPLECEQVRGPHLFEDLLERGAASGLRHYFLGGSPETLDRLVQQVGQRFPSAEIAGSFSPPFRTLTTEELAAQDESIRQSGANLVWVGLGTPKQDFEAARLVETLGITAVAVGAAFDFTAGTKSVAPTWMRGAHLEWLFRLATEPRRLWRRYLIGNPIFLWMALVHLYRRRGSSQT